MFLTKNLNALVNFKKIGRTGIIELNRVDKLNVINLSMVRDIRSQLDEWVYDNKAEGSSLPEGSVNPKIDVLLLKSACNNQNAKISSFSAGGDVREMTSNGREDPQIGKDFMYHEYKLDYKLATLPKSLFQVSFYNGIVMGGGVGISINSKYRVVTEKTVFSMPETTIGFFPDVGSSYFLNKFCRDKPELLSKYFGIYLGLTSSRIYGYDNLLAGVGTHYCCSEKLGELIAEIEALPSSSNKVIKIPEILSKFEHLSIRQLDLTYPDANDERNFSFNEYMDEINSSFRHRTVSEIKNSLERLIIDLGSSTSSSFCSGQENKKLTWATETLKTINNLSPTSMEITLKQLKKGLNDEFSLEEALKMEYGMGCKCMDNADFFEGVRAVLIEKSFDAKWADYKGDKEDYFYDSGWRPDCW